MPSHFETSPRHRPHVDHFVPWARHPNNAIQNLVVAHEHCNNAKRDFLAASDHVARWRERLDNAWEAAGLEAIARDSRWENNARRSFSVTRGVYLRLPARVPLWLRGQDFVALDREHLIGLLGRELSTAEGSLLS